MVLISVGGFGVLDRFQFIFSWFYSFWSKGEPQEGHFLVPEYRFIQVYLEVVLVQSCQDLIQNLQVFFMGVGVY